MPDHRGYPSKPGENTCAWCGERATKAFELVGGRKKAGKGQFIYTCPRHHEKAEDLGAQHRPYSENTRPRTDF